MQLQPRLFVRIHNNHRLRWCQWHMRRLWGRLQLRWEWRAGGRVHVFSRLCLDRDDIERLHCYHGHVHIGWM